MKTRNLLAVCAFFWIGVASLALAQTASRPDSPEPRAKQSSTPVSAQTIFAEAFELLKEGRPAEAAQRFDAGLKLEPKNAMAWFYFGEARLRMGANIAALTAYKRSIELDARSQVADAARGRVDELQRASGSTAKTTGKHATPKDAYSITLDSGLTLADWLQYSVEQLKKGEVDKVLQDGTEYHKRYGAIPSLVAVLERAVEDKLAHVAIDDANSAAKAVPMLEPLAKDFPGSIANVKLNRARALIELENARAALAAGKFQVAEQAYRALLPKLPIGDPLRIDLVPEIEAARKREKFTFVVPVVRDCPACPEMVAIPAGSFLMGSSDSEPSRDAVEGPQHRVQVQSFLLGRTEVTQGQWQAIMGNNPSKFSSCGDDCPVENVSWQDAQEYIARLNHYTGKSYRLPTEAEWEYAARGGTTTAFWWGSAASHEFANFGKDRGQGLAQGRDRWVNTAPVAQFPANAFGLHDMHGNVWELVQDVYHDSYDGAPSDGSAWTAGGDQTGRVRRGGSYGNDPQGLRSAVRSYVPPHARHPGIGFRVARTAF
jgi:formylglycine-generating enzyme required for sulfatase activity